MYPKVSQHIDIEINHDHSCRSVVAEVGENEIYINFPMDRTIIGMLSIGTKLDISFIVEGNRYQFVSEIIGRKIDGIPLIKITKPNENSISKIQLREYFRVSAFLNLKIKEQDLVTSNLSAGGLLFNSDIDFEIEEGEIVSGTLFIPNPQSKVTDMVAFQGQIKRITPLDDIGKKNAGIEFLSINKRDQSKIQQYCFAKQRQIRAKGL